MTISPREKHAINRQKVNDYFHRNPFANQHHCADAIGIHYQTVQKHVNALKKEWFACLNQPDELENLESILSGIAKK